jgi:pimeloyl-ACP methyl ester carboxylesterase
MKSVPETRYAKGTGGYNIAYQVAGDSDVDLVFVPGFVSHVELSWEWPLLARFVQRLSSFSRLILFDKRGTGLSDRVPASEVPTHEERMDDVRAVMDAAGSERAAVFGVSEGGPMSVLFAATYPERVSHLALYGTQMRFTAAEDHDWLPPEEDLAELADFIEQEWANGPLLDVFAPSMVGDEAFEQWWARGASQRGQSRSSGGGPTDDPRHRRSSRAAFGARAYADRASRERPPGAGVERPLRRGADTRREVRGAAWRGPHAMGR